MSKDKSITKRIHKLDMNIMENKMCYLILLYNYEYLEYDDICYIKRKEGISRINDKQLGILMCSYTKKKEKNYIYGNEVCIGRKKPLQIIALPKEKIDIKIDIPILNRSLSSKIVYKYILNNK